MANHIGEQLGNYRLTRLLGQGGFAEVYLAEHVYLRTQAAIKLLYGKLTGQDIQAFTREAQTIAALRHSHILRILDFGFAQMLPFLVMDYAPGGTLRDRHASGSPVSLPQVILYVKQVAGALAYAHANKLIHRDVKPENMLLAADGSILLSDFGIVTIAHSTASMKTIDNTGTVHYMAPEQIKGKPRPASDQYALAICVYEWLCGERPFLGDTHIEIAMRQISDEPPSLCQKVPSLPPMIEQTVFKALAKDPQQRFATIDDFVIALEQAVSPVHLSLPPTLPGLSSPYLSATSIPPVSAIPSTQPIRQRGELLFTYRHKDECMGAFWSPDSTHIASSDQDSLAVWNASTGHLLFPPISNHLTAFSWSPDGTHIATGFSRLYLYESRTGQEVFASNDDEIDSYSRCIRWSSNGVFIATCSSDTLQLLKTATMQVFQTYEAATGMVGGWDWSPDGQYLIVSSTDDDTFLWENREYMQPPKKKRPALVDLERLSLCDDVFAWSPDGKHIAAAGIGDKVLVWNTTNGALQSLSWGEITSIRSLTWSPNNQYIAGSGDSIVKVWHVASRRQIFTYRGHRADVTSVAWSPDGTRIASASEDKTVQVWDACWS